MNCRGKKLIIDWSQISIKVRIRIGAGMGEGPWKIHIVNVSSQIWGESEGLKHMMGGASLSSTDTLVKKNRFSYDFRGVKFLVNDLGLSSPLPGDCPTIETKLVFSTYLAGVHPWLTFIFLTPDRLRFGLLCWWSFSLLALTSRASPAPLPPHPTAPA